MELTPRTQNAIFSSSAFVNGGTFTQHNGPSIVNQNGATASGFELLRKEVATAAFHNSEQRGDLLKCHPNTRLAVLQKLMEWIQSSEDRDTWIMWLHGAAGAGKSAIAQSIAELCMKSKLAIASFFFYRKDPTCNNPKALGATLAYQLTGTYPAARDMITLAIDNDPLVFRRSFKSQLESLIVEPLSQLGPLSNDSTNDAPPFLVIIDGLDECHSRGVQTNLIYAIADVLRDRGLSIIFLISSRAEQHLTMAFTGNFQTVVNLVTRLPLDDSYLPDEDIRLFLHDKFADIRTSHPFNHRIDSPWPTTEFTRLASQSRSRALVTERNGST